MIRLLQRKIHPAPVTTGQHAAWRCLHQSEGGADQGGLAGAVGSDQRDDLAGANAQADAREQHPGARAQVQIANLQQRALSHARGPCLRPDSAGTAR